ncbi:MAG: hypothetical protein HYZ34_03120 [Ignavibacteriae bacterium]|nr:hypothetical protein [Ignavibacteriota bacterium]
MTKHYHILLFDIIRSRRLTNRDNATKKMKQAINRINTHYKKNIYAPLEITRGDEVATVLNNIENAYDIIREFMYEIQPFRCRCTIAYGTLTAGITSKRSTVMDGPGFYLADETLKKLKKTYKQFQINIPQHEVTASVISGLANLLFSRIEGLTIFQLRVVALSRQGLSQSEIAKNLRRTPQQVSTALRAIPYDVFFEGEHAIRILFKQLQATLSKKKT